MGFIRIKDGDDVLQFKIKGDEPTFTEADKIKAILENRKANIVSKPKGSDTLRDLDRKSGIKKFGLRAALAGAEKKEEEENILRKNYGLDDEDFTRDNRGRLAITKSGGDKLGLNLDRTTLVDEEGFSRYDFSADLAGIAPELAGGVAGSLKGAAIGSAFGHL